MKKSLILFIMMLFSAFWVFPICVQAQSDDIPPLNVLVNARGTDLSPGAYQGWVASFEYRKRGTEDEYMAATSYGANGLICENLEAGEYEYKVSLFGEDWETTYQQEGTFNTDEVCVRENKKKTMRYGYIAFARFEVGGSDLTYGGLVPFTPTVSRVDRDGGGNSYKVPLCEGESVINEDEWGGYTKAVYYLETQYRTADTIPTSNFVPSCSYTIEVRPQDQTLEVIYPDGGVIGRFEDTSVGGGANYISCRFRTARWQKLSVTIPKESGVEVYIHANGLAYAKQNKVEVDSSKSDDPAYDVYEYTVPCNKEVDLVAGGGETIYKRTALELKTQESDLSVNVGLEKKDEPTKYRKLDLGNDIYTNVKNSYLSLRPGETKDLEAFRVPQTTNGYTTNRFIEPEMRFTPIYGANKIELTESARSGFGRRYTQVKAKEDATGIAIIKVTYDEMNVRGANYPAIDDCNAGIIIINFDDKGLSPGMKITCHTSGQEIEFRNDYDTIYIPREVKGEGVSVNSTAQYTFTPPSGSEVFICDPIKASTNTVKDESEWKKVTVKADGTAVLDIQEGKNIVKISKDGASAYTAIQGKYLDITVENKTREGESPRAGDKLAVSFKGLELPVYKMACIYNPGYDGASGTTYVKYWLGLEGAEKKDLDDLEGQHSQYDISTRNTVEFEVEEGGGTYVLSGGQIHGQHLGSGLWAHMTIPPLGATANFGAGNGGTEPEYSILPDITIDVVGMETCVEALIDKIDGEWPYRTINEIREAWTTYNAMKKRDQMKVDRSKYDKMFRAYNTNIIPAVIEVMDAIEGLPEKEDVAVKDLERIKKVYIDYEDSIPHYSTSLEEQIEAAYGERTVKIKDLKGLADSVDSVIDQIDTLLTKGDLTLADKAGIEAARAAYDALDPKLQAGVDNRADLVRLESRISTLETDQAVIQAVIQRIEEVRDITAENYTSKQKAVIIARDQYERLTDGQKAMVTNAEVLTQAEAAIEQFQAGEAARAVESEIAAIGEITAENYKTQQQKVLTARNHYGYLTDAQKAMVTNLAVLEQAEAAIRQFQQADGSGSVQAIIEQIGILRVQADGTPGPLAQANSLETWKSWEGYVLSLRGMVDRLAPESQAAITNLEDLKLAEECIKGNNAAYITDLVSSLPSEEELGQRVLTEEELAAVATAMGAYRSLTPDVQEQLQPEVIQKLTFLDQKAAGQSEDGSYLKQILESFTCQVDGYCSQYPQGVVTRAQIEEVRQLLAQYDAYTQEYKDVLDTMQDDQGVSYGQRMAALQEQIEALESEDDEIAAINASIGALPQIVTADVMEQLLQDIADIEQRYETLSEDGKSQVDLAVANVLKNIAQGLKTQIETFKGTAVSGVKAAALTYNKIRVTWDRNSDATAYILQRREGRGNWKTLRSVDTASYTDTSVKTGTAYAYRVRAVSKRWGNEDVAGRYGAGKSVKPSLKAASLSSVRAVSRSAIRVAWKKVDGASGYEVYRSTSKKGRYTRVKTIAKGGTLSFTDKKLSKNKGYYYRVRAYRKVGGKKVYSAYSGVKGAKTKKR